MAVDSLWRNDMTQIVQWFKQKIPDIALVCFMAIFLFS